MSNILTLNYDKRRVLIIAPEDGDGAQAAGVNWKGLAVAAGVGGVAAAVGLGGPPTWLLAVAAKLGHDRLANPRGTAPGCLVVTTEQTTEIAFPPGHPMVGHAYAGHPLDASRYMPVFGFHGWLFEEKVNELMRLLACLGARRARVRFDDGYKSSGAVVLSGQQPSEHGPKPHKQTGSADPDHALQERHSRERSANFDIEEEFTPRGEPRLHERRVWYAHEPSWVALAERRLEHGVKKFKGTLEYKEDFGISGELVTLLEGWKVRVGGSYASFESTKWSFEGEYE